MNFKIKIRQKEYEVSVGEAGGPGKIKVSINGRDFIFEDSAIPTIKNEDKRHTLEKASKGKDEIKAPLSGIISSIFVKEGEEVSPGQKLLMLSAMKMENEIVSEVAGKVKTISVSKDQKVKEGEILMVLNK